MGIDTKKQNYICTCTHSQVGGVWNYPHACILCFAVQRMCYCYSLVFCHTCLGVWVHLCVHVCAHASTPVQ